MTDASSPATQADPVLVQAQQLLDARQYGEIVSLMNTALQEQPTNPDYISALAKGLMPGPGYKRWLHRLHREMEPAS